MTREQIGRVMRSLDFTAAEKRLLEYFYPHPSGGHGFRSALFEAIFRADDENQRRLALGFPDDVDAVQHWTHGDLRQKMEAVANGEEAACKEL